MKDFRKLEVWRRAHALNRWVYALVDSYPGLVRHGLAVEMRQASTEIACNIARGCGSSGNDGAERWYCNVALGALASLDCLMFLAFDLRLIPHGCAERFLAMKVRVQEKLRAMLNEEETEARAPASLTLVQ
jgi:four helix bundle protein